MCGINGIKNFNQAPVQKAQLAAMNQLMVHRGPDDDGYYLHQSIGLAMRRLSIIDLSTGSQPISNENNTIQVVFNGEIYNYIELRQALIARGHRFKTNSDTEVIVHLYEEKGVKMLDDLNGVFCFALWDDQKKQLFIARDRLGVKPLFYFKTEKQWTFGINGSFFFGKDIRETGIFDSLITPDGYIVSQNGEFADIRLYERGFTVSVTAGRLFTLRMPNPNSALSSNRELAQAGPRPALFVV